MCIYTYIHIYIYMYKYVCVYLHTCVRLTCPKKTRRRILYYSVTYLRYIFIRTFHTTRIIRAHIQTSAWVFTECLPISFSPFLSRCGAGCLFVPMFMAFLDEVGLA